MYISRLGVLLLPAMLVTTSCATSTQSASQGRSGGRYLITAEEVAAAAERNAFDLVQRLRPNWLRPRGTETAQGTVPVVVYVDGMRRGGVDALSSLRLDEVTEMRFLDGPDATLRYGINVGGGVIEVVTRRGGPS